MGVTRLERKGRKNKTVAKVRVATIKRLKSKITIASGYKEESGVIVGDVEAVMKDIQAQPKPEKNVAPAKAKKELAEVEAKSAEETVEAVDAQVEKPKAKTTRKAAPKAKAEGEKPVAKKPAAKKKAAPKKDKSKDAE